MINFVFCSTTKVLSFTVLQFVFLGSSYYLGFFTNFKKTNTSIIILTTESQPVSYSIEIPGIENLSGNVTSNNEGFVELPSSVIVHSRKDQDNGVYLKTSSDRVTVIGQSVVSHSVDTFLSIPTMSLCTEEYNYYGISTANYNESVYGAILIVGTESNTIMNLTATQHVYIKVNDTAIEIHRGREYPFVINRLQTVLVKSKKDLTGTKIVTNKPVSVFSGQECSSVSSKVGTCDYLIEQVPPTIYWGRVHYIVPIATRIEYSIKVLAGYDSTYVCIYCNGTRISDYSINGGEFFTRSFQCQEYCVLHSSKGVLVSQFNHGQHDDSVGDPFMTLVPATTQYMNKFSFSTLHNPSRPGYKHFVNIMVLAQYYEPNMIYLISGGVNKSLTTQEWIPVEGNNVTEAYATTVNISEGTVEIIHTDTSALMTAIVYGHDNFESYGNPGGFNSYAGTYANLTTPIFVLYSNVSKCMHLMLKQPK